MSRTSRIVTTLGLVAVVVFGSQSAAVAADGWWPISNKEGIVVTGKDVPGKSMPRFRGVGVIEANWFHVLAVISDVARHCEWRPRCRDAHVIEQVGPKRLVMYTRNPAPWPVSDRDVVLLASVRFQLDKGVIWSDFRNAKHSKMLEKDGVVRILRLRGYYKLRKLGERRTLLTILVNADVGGWVPKWVASRTSRVIPHVTITGLRKQTKRTRGQYKNFLDRWDPARKSAPAALPASATAT